MRIFDPILTGSITITGVIPGGITSSLQGTASFAQNALTASFASTASYILQAVSASNASTASLSIRPFSVIGTTLYSTVPNANINTATSNAHWTSSIFIGAQTGLSTQKADYAIFIGDQAGSSATSASHGVFIGRNAGNQATFASQSIIIGNGAGNFAASASYSTIIGYNASRPSTAATTPGTNNIIIGTNVSVGPGISNAINLGGIIFATGSYFDITSVASYSGSVAGGRVGINAPIPAYSLDVSGSGNYTSGLTVTGSLRVTSSADHYIFGGNVGIGTTSPNRRGYDANARVLTVFGRQRGILELGSETPINNDIIGGIVFQSGSLYKSQIICRLDGASSASFEFYTGASNNASFYISASGNVGIGTTTPSHTLTVSGSSPRITINSSGLGSNAGLRFNALDSGGTSKAAGYYFQPETGASSYLALSADDINSHLTIKSNGNVGIGTTTPAEKLDVNGNANISGSITTNGFTLKGDPGDANYNTRTRIIQDSFTISNAAAVNFDIDTLVSNALFTIEVSAMSYTGGTSYWEHGIGRGYLFPSGFGISYTSLSNSGLSVALSYQNSSTVRVALTDTVSGTSKSAVIRITVTAGYI